MSSKLEEDGGDLEVSTRCLMKFNYKCQVVCTEIKKNVGICCGLNSFDRDLAVFRSLVNVQGKYLNRCELYFF